MRPDIYGVMAEFNGPEELIAATRKAHAAGYRRMDAYTPYPIEEVMEEIAPADTGVPRIVLLAGLVGAASGFILQYVGSFLDYRINVGGRPLGNPAEFNLTFEGIAATFDGWQAFIPVTFEFGILLAAFGAVFGMIALNGFPMPYHPVFNVPRFDRASQDAFFLCIEANDPLFDRLSTQQFLRSLGPRQVNEVEY
ncbi:MAG: DUF3341 domain-containing protein [Chloroflexales bacterium]|nr:DUF3341 domain-containing protein [Chloroflexales bacterium]